jgi:hypothetical protein
MPRIPAIPAPTTWVGMDAPPVEEEEEAGPFDEEAADVAADPSVVEPAAVEEVVFKNLPVVAVVLLLNKPPLPMGEGVTAAPPTVRR